MRLITVGELITKLHNYFPEDPVAYDLWTVEEVDEAVGEVDEAVGDLYIDQIEDWDGDDTRNVLEQIQHRINRGNVGTRQDDVLNATKERARCMGYKTNEDEDQE